MLIQKGPLKGTRLKELPIITTCFQNLYPSLFNVCLNMERTYGKTQRFSGSDLYVKMLILSCYREPTWPSACSIIVVNRDTAFTDF